jgi:hypothetical protein
MVNLTPGFTCTICTGPVPPSREPRAACLDPECVREVSRIARTLTARRWRIQRERQPTRVCTECQQELDKDQFRIHRRYDDGTVAREAKCRTCRHLLRQEWRKNNPERDREIGRAAHRRYTEKIYAGGEDAEQRRERRNASQRAWRTGTGRDKAREAARRYREGVKKDPERHRARIERRRINAKIRRSVQTGAPVEVVEQVKLETGRTRIPRVPSAPLAAAVIQQVDVYAREHAMEAGIVRDGFSREMLLQERFGITQRTLFAWKTGDRTACLFDAADRVLIGLDRNWYEVYDPEDWQRGMFDTHPGRDVIKAIDAALAAQRSFEGVDAFEDD